MKAEAIDAIAGLALGGQYKEPLTKDILGKIILFTPDGKGGFNEEIKGGPGVVPHPLVMHTLTGLIAYLALRPAEDVGALPKGSSAVGRDGALTDQVIVHVVNQQHIRVLSALDEDAAAYRTEYATAAFEPLIGSNGVPFTFGKYLDLETFNIALQSLFEDTTDRTRALMVAGTVRDEKVTTSRDDGVTQTVMAQAGVVGLYETEIPNPVKLKPFRTFREIDQPESLFILRFKRGENGNLPTAALFEADGGAWKLEAIQRIATYLRNALPDTVTVLA